MVRRVALLTQVRQHEMLQSGVRARARDRTGFAIAQVAGHARNATLHRDGVWPARKHRFVVIGFQHEHFDVAQHVPQVQ
jgi:hypothetical protein